MLFATEKSEATFATAWMYIYQLPIESLFNSRIGRGMRIGLTALVDEWKLVGMS